MAGDTPRVHEVKSPLPPDANGESPLLLRQLIAREEISRPFEYVADLLSMQAVIDPNKLLGKSMTVLVRLADGRIRYFDGLVSHFSFRGVETGYASYRAVLRPWFWFLTRNVNCRIFQEVSVPEVFEKVVKDTHSFSDYRLSLNEQYKKREYCVQYRESDFDFISRLIEEEGIFYFFEHEEGKHTLVLGDSKSAFSDIDGSEATGSDIPYRSPGEASTELEHISEWQVLHEFQTVKVALDDFDFKKPRVDLLKQSSVTRDHALAKYEFFDYPGLYIEASDGEALAKVRVEEIQSRFKRLAGISDHRGMTPGVLFNLAEYPREGEDGEYVLLKTEIEVESAEIEQLRADARNRFDVKFVAQPGDDPFRPPRQTRKPLVYGPQTAIVVGKSGEEIWTDKYGRVKLQFHWDREGESNENSSCWVRVSQAWAGSNWGSIHIPRIGQEVVVSFLEGDPDRPLITGRVYNEDMMPPYPLPDNQTQSGLMSRSSKNGTPELFNEIRFEDKSGEEQIYFHAQKDFERIVENNDTLKVGSSEAEDGSQTIEIWKDRKAEIKTGNDSLKVSAGERTVEAAKKITLKVGGSTITIEPAKISLSSPEISIQGNTKVAATAPMTEVSGSATLTLSGGIVKIN
ncbi:MAG TPA: type VI secretion system tip protein TssI/VgrG [Lacipirellulaceae bacterium]|nr:type VI secretion system tip protein TssI/VgrG [Lacipirellulaceae bacterium]